MKMFLLYTEHLKKNQKICSFTEKNVHVLIKHRKLKSDWLMPRQPMLRGYLTECFTVGPAYLQCETTHSLLQYSLSHPILSIARLLHPDRTHMPAGIMRPADPYNRRTVGLQT